MKLLTRYNQRPMGMLNPLACIDECCATLVHDIEVEIRALGEHHRWSSQWSRHLKIILANLISGVQCGDVAIGYKRDKNEYNKATLSYSALIKVVAWLVRLGYVDEQRSTGQGIQSTIMATDKLIGFIVGMANAKPICAEIVLRDAEKCDIRYQETDVVSRMRANLKIINEALSSACIGLCVDELMLMDISRQIAKKGEGKCIDFSHTQLKRIFNNSDFTQGGRFYGGWWQEVPSDFRNCITIDDESTIEVDFSGLHPAMLYAREGALLSGDPYLIAGFETRRAAIKVAANIMLNSKTDAKALGAIYSEDDCQCIRGEGKQVMAALRSKHAPISKHFCSGAGVKLQFDDSQMAEEILLTLAVDNIVALPIHDSFIVKKKHMTQLINTMHRVSKSRYRKTFNTKKCLTTEEETRAFVKAFLDRGDSFEPTAEDIEMAFDVLSEMANEDGKPVPETQIHRYYCEQVRQLLIAHS